MSRKDTQTDKHKNRWTTCVTWLWTKWTPSRNVICSMDKQQLGRHTLSQEKPDGLASQTTAGQTNTVQKKARWTYISNNSWADKHCPKKSQMDLHIKQQLGRQTLSQEKPDGLTSLRPRTISTSRFLIHIHDFILLHAAVCGALWKWTHIYI